MRARKVRGRKWAMRARNGWKMNGRVIGSAQFEGEARWRAGAHRHGLYRLVAAAAKTRVPQGDAVGAGSKAFDLGATIEIARGRKGRRDDADVAAHLVVDVATQRHGAGQWEALRVRLVTAVEIYLEARGLREAVNAVAYGIEIGKGDAGALGHDQRARHKCLVTLGHGASPWKSERAIAPRRRGHFNDDALNGQATLIQELDDARLGPGRRHAKQASKPQ